MSSSSSTLSSSESTSTWLLETSSSSSSSTALDSTSSQTNSTSSSTVSTSSSTSSESSSCSSFVKKTLLPFSLGGIVWNRTKLLATQVPAISVGSAKNRLAQPFRIPGLTYDIGNISVFLERKLGDSFSSFNLHAQLWEADANGTPTYMITSAIKSSSLVSDAGWYYFPLNTGSRTSPASQLLCLVFYQDGGDENNYVAWYYTPEPTSFVLYSNTGGAPWSKIPKAIMSLKVMRRSDIFSEAYKGNHDHVITSSPGTPSEMTGRPSLSGSFHNTRLVGSSVVMDFPKLLAGIVMDTSGSMGWNDRAKKRVDSSAYIVDKLKSEYPGEILFDFVNVGSIGLSAPSFSSTSQTTPIRLMLDSPSRKTSNRDGSSPQISNGIVAYGFKNLESGHSYVFAGIKTGDVILDDCKGLVNSVVGQLVPDNFQSIGMPGEEITFTMTSQGPSNSDAVGALVPVGSKNIIRKPLAKGHIVKSVRTVVNSFKGDTSVNVETPSIFGVDNVVDFTDTNGLSSKHTIKSIDPTMGGAITFAPPLVSDIGSGLASSGGIIQDSSSASTIFISGANSIELLVLDEEASSSISFYVQTTLGGVIEWDFLPLDEWKTTTWVYSDMPSTISANITDNNGEPYPSTYEIHYFVDEPPDWEAQVQEDKIVAFDPPLRIYAGEDTLALDSVEGINKGDGITFYVEGGGSFEEYVVDEVDPEAKTVKFSPPFYQDANIVEVLFYLIPGDKNTGEELSILVSALDISPVTAGRSISPSLLLPTDPIPIPPATPDVSIYYGDESKWLHRSFDVPIVRENGGLDGVASIHILPITEDKLKTISEKQQSLQDVAPDSVLTDDERQQIEALEDAYSDLKNEAADESLFVEPDVLSEESSTEDLNYILTDTYRLDPARGPVGGQSVLTDWNASLSEKEVGRLGFGYNMEAIAKGIQPGTVLAKDHTVYYGMVAKDQNGNIKARYLLGSSDVSFVSPLLIYSKTEEGKTITYTGCYCKESEDEWTSYTTTVPAVYAESGESISIDYIVYNKGVPLPTGTLKIKMYDRNRTVLDMTSPQDIVPDITADICFKGGDCSLLPSQASYQYQAYSRGSSFISGNNKMAEATYIPGYALGGIEIPIVDGRASIKIDAVDRVVARILVVAEVESPDTAGIFVARFDDVWFSNPLTISLLVSEELPSGYDKTPYPITATLQYKGVPEGTDVLIKVEGSEHTRNMGGGPFDADSSMIQSLQKAADLTRSEKLKADIEALTAETGTWLPTPIIPSVSKTINGVASDMFIGPHGPVINKVDRATAEENGDKESVSATATYKGWTATTSQVVEWMGSTPGPEDYFIYATFYVDGYRTSSPVLYADGWSKAFIVLDIPESNNLFYPLLSKEEGIQDNLLGFGRLNNKGAICAFSGDHVHPIPGKDMRFSSEQPQDPFTGQYIGEPIDEAGNRGWAAAMVSGSFIPQKSPKCQKPCCPTVCEEIRAMVVAKGYNDKVYIFFGCDSISHPACVTIEMSELTGKPSKKYSRPKINWKNPLSSAFFINGKTALSKDPDIPPSLFIRDGITENVVDVEISFSGEPIPFVAKRHNVKNPDGSDKDMPVVNFDVYYKVDKIDSKGRVISTSVVRDGTLTLSSYEVKSSLSKLANANGHYHLCDVDSYGNGTTTATYKESSLTPIADHVHLIDNYSVYPTQDENDVLHSHSLQSVARTVLRPISNQSNVVCVNASFSYDASETYYDRSFSSEYCDKIPPESDFWEIQLFTPPSAMASEDVLSPEGSGFVCTAKISHKINGSKVAVPDGMRMSFTLTPYQSISSEEASKKDRGVPVFDITNGIDSAKRDYFNLKVNSSIYPSDILMQQSSLVKVKSSLVWSPSVATLVDDPTNDDIYIDQALSKIPNNIGPSQIFDGIYLAANRMINWQSKNPSWKYASKMLFILSDGDENTSERSLDQAIDRVNLISGSKKSPVNCLMFGDVNASDFLIAEKITTETGGSIAVIPLGYPVSSISSLVDGMMSYGSSDFNSGSYQDVVDLGSSEYARSVSVSLSVPAGSSVSFQAQFSDDGFVYGGWTSLVQLVSSGNIMIEKQGRYMRYRLGFYGSSDFLSPAFSSVNVDFIKHSVDTVFFQPLDLNPDDDSYVSDIVVTHSAKIPTNSSIEYGSIQADTNKSDECYSLVVPLVQAGRRNILLARENEEMKTTDRLTYSLVGGSWPQSSSIDVIRFMPGDLVGTLVLPSTYIPNASDGAVRFLSIQAEDSRFVASISMPRMLRIICKITNRSEETASIDHVGVMYNMTKRIVRNLDGTIIRRSVAMDLDMSSSSSSSST